MSDVKVPEGWKAESLGELCKFSGGSAFKEIYQGNTQGDYPFIKVSDMNIEGNQRFIVYANNWIDHKVKLEAKIKLFPAATVVFAKVGAALLLNRRRILTRETAIDNNMMAAIPIKDDNNFLYYLLQTIDLGEIVQDGAVPSVNQAQMEDIPVLIPPLPEQQKIAIILTSVDTVIEKTRAQIDKLKHLKTAMMQELLTKGIGHTEFKGSPVGRIPKAWKASQLGELFDLRNGVNKGKEAFGSGVPIISYRNVYNGNGICDSNIVGLVEMTESELSRFKCAFGDVFFTRTSETQEEIGYSNVYLGNRDDVVFSGFVIRARQRGTDFYPEFLKYAFQSYSIRKQMIHNSKFTTRAGIASDGLNSIEIAIPPILEQQKIADILQSIDISLQAANQKMVSLDNTKKAMMQDLLTGTVQVIAR